MARIRGNSTSPTPIGPRQTLAQPHLSSRPPAGLPAWISAEAIDDTLATFQPFYERQLTADDAVEMLLSVGRLFDMLKGEENAPQ